MVNARNIDPKLYRTFLAVADSKTYLEAAEKMNTSVKSISNDIRLLENQLDVQLFNRKNKGSNKELKLTKIGEEILPQAQKVISACDFMPMIIENVNNLENGVLSIGCPSHITDFYLMEKLLELKNDYPKIKIHLDSESSSKRLINSLKNNNINFMILDTIPEEYMESFEIEKIKDIENIFISKERVDIKNIEDITKYRYILSYKDRTSTRRLNEVLKQYKIKLDVILECPTTEERVKAAKLGIGIGYVMKEAVKKELENGELYEVKVPIQIPMNSISLLYVKDQLTKVDRKFIKKYIKE